MPVFSVPAPRRYAALEQEAGKLAANARYRAECQITGCGFWGNFQLIVGGSAAIAAGIAGASAFSDQSVVAGAFAIAASVLSAILASVKAGERASAHTTSANGFNLVAEHASRLRELCGYEIRHDGEGAGAHDAPHGAISSYEALVTEWDQLVRAAPFVNRRLCKRAVRFIEQDTTYYSAPPMRTRTLRLTQRLRLLFRGSTERPTHESSQSALP